MTDASDDLVERLLAVGGGFISPLSPEDTRTVKEAAARIEADRKRIEALEAALEKVASNAPMKEPSAEPTVGPPPGWREEMSDYVYDIVQQAFNEGHTRACWEAGQIADAATAERAS